MGCLSGIAKYILFLFNLLILIAAIALIAVGVIYHKKNAGLDILSVSSFTIAVGVIIALVSFFGCCGAIKESICLLTTYAFVMITIFIIQVVLVVLAFLALKNGNAELDNEVHKYLRKIYEKIFTSEADADVVKALQEEFECCGIDGTFAIVTKSTGYLIDSCCKSEPVGKCTSAQAYKLTCAQALVDFIGNNAKIIGGIAVGVAAVELAAAIMAYCVRDSAR